MFNHTLQHIKPFQSIDPSSAYIIIQHTDQIPPHIGFIFEGKYYSSSVSGVKMSVEVHSVIKNIQSRNIPALLIELKPLKVSEEWVRAVFNEYGPLDSEEKSCLFPIIELLNKSYSIILESEFVFELLKELEQLQLVTQMLEINMDHLLVKMEYSLPVYTRDEIRFCIRRLQEKQTV